MSQFQQALFLHQQGHFEEAISIYQQLNRIEPNINILFNWGMAERTLGHHQKAEEIFLSILRLDPLHTKTKQSLALLYFDMHRLFDAEKCLRSLLADDPWNPAFNNNLAGILIAQGRPNEACSLLYPVLKKTSFFPVGWDSLGAALLDMGELETALSVFYRAHQQAPQNAEILFHLHGVLHDLQQPNRAIDVIEQAVLLAPNRWELQFFAHCLHSFYDNTTRKLHASKEYKPWVMSWDYIQQHRCDNLEYFCSVAKTLEFAISKAPSEGIILEFGVRYGTSIRMLQKYGKQAVHGFDSFQGLPTAWHDLPKGSYSTNGCVPDLGNDIILHVGWFQDSIPHFIKTIPTTERLRLLHIDCDLYSSTKEILEQLRPWIRPNLVIVFDEYICNPRWQEDEFKAWQEFVHTYNIQYQYLAFSPLTSQAVIQVLEFSSDIS